MTVTSSVCFVNEYVKTVRQADSVCGVKVKRTVGFYGSRYIAVVKAPSHHCRVELQQHKYPTGDCVCV